RDKMVAMLDELKETRKQADLAYQILALDVDRLVKLNPSGTNETALPLVSKFELQTKRLLQEDAESKQHAVAAKEKTIRAELQALEVQLDFYQLKTPIAGILGPIQVVLGQTLTPGTVVADVTDLSHIDVVAFAPPRTAKKLRVDHSVWLGGKDPSESK